MEKERLLAFSDGVIAIIITIMVLELKVPHGPEVSDLAKLWPTLLSYVMSFVYIAIYWNNHHHMMHLVQRVNGAVLWANTHLLFWLSLVPFATDWMGENHFAPVPVAVYGVSLFMPAVAYYILERTLLAFEGPESDLAKAIHVDFKEIASLVIYGVAIPMALWLPWGACGLYGAVACIWFIPDRRVERMVQGE